MSPSPDPAAVFAALGDPTRLEIVTRLSDDGPLTVSRLTVGAGITRQAISKHVRVLQDAGLVRGTRQGRERRLELDPHRLAEAQRCLEQISAEWDAALDRLRRFIER